MDELSDANYVSKLNNIITLLFVRTFKFCGLTNVCMFYLKLYWGIIFKCLKE